MSSYDVIIAGAGIVGLAAAYQLLEKNSKIKLLILEKESQEATHQTGNNSGVIHSGIYYKPGSYKAKNCIEGYNQLIKFCNENEIKYEICGKIILASQQNELETLDNIYNRGIANGLHKIKYLSKDEIKEYEPFAEGLKAIHVPYTGIIDFKQAAKKLKEKILLKGAAINFSEKVKKIISENREIKSETNKNSYSCKVFVNCCGLQSDEAAELTEDKLDIRIIPFRGEYYKIKPERRYLVKNLIYPVPNPQFPFLGVHFTRMITGEIEAGPNAVLSFKKEGYKKLSFSLTDTMRILSWKGFYKLAGKYFKTGAEELYRSLSKKSFTKSLQKLVPSISEDDLIQGGAGVRAQAIKINGEICDDFEIRENNNVINVLNAPSPAATSSLSIGEYISEKIINKLN